MDDRSIFEFYCDRFICAFHEKSVPLPKNGLVALLPDNVGETGMETAGQGLSKKSGEWRRVGNIPDELHFGVGWRSAALPTDGDVDPRKLISCKQVLNSREGNG